jgi:2-polyprenyl-3-methyl-5-hydroxy-6-metoxy-1,4-benzoquinol methylase
MKHTYYVRQSYLFCLYRNAVYDFKKYLSGRNVLEVGPNKGNLFERYYPLTKRYTLLEPNPHFEKYFARLQRKHPNVDYQIKSFEAFAPTERYDTVVMMAVISHIRASAAEIFAKIDACLANGGFLLVETNNTKRNLDVFELLDRHYERLETKTSYRGLLKKLNIDARDVLVYRKGAAMT